MNNDLPRISAIMPTTGSRLVFLPQAIQFFQRQTYPNKELIIVNQYGLYDPVERFIPDEEDILYIPVARDLPLTIGAKRNLACSLATGDILCQWDDDDIWGPDRLWKQAEPILRGDADVTGMPMRLCLHLATMRLWRCSEKLHQRLFPHSVRCGTLMYTKKFINETIWYPNASRGEDIWFLSRLLHHGARLVAVDDPASYICVRHGDNVTDEMEYGPPGWQEEPLEQYLSPELRSFYASMQEVARV